MDRSTYPMKSCIFCQPNVRKSGSGGCFLLSTHRMPLHLRFSGNICSLTWSDQHGNKKRQNWVQKRCWHFTRLEFAKNKSFLSENSCQEALWFDLPTQRDFFWRQLFFSAGNGSASPLSSAIDQTKRPVAKKINFCCPPLPMGNREGRAIRYIFFRKPPPAAPDRKNKNILCSMTCGGN